MIFAFIFLTDCYSQQKKVSQSSYKYIFDPKFHEFLKKLSEYAEAKNDISH